MQISYKLTIQRLNIDYNQYPYHIEMCKYFDVLTYNATYIKNKKKCLISCYFIQLS